IRVRVVAIHEDPVKATGEQAASIKITGLFTSKKTKNAKVQIMIFLFLGMTPIANNPISISIYRWK
ncbi:MAG TPA: hypothetical protein VJ873_05055, partial [bacterium]|nr:hypothetical protein [bacterium]